MTAIPSQRPDKDHFTSLPPEILQQIASYLYATHNPRRAHDDLLIPPRPNPKPPLLSLALTSKILHTQTNAWAQHHLHAHRAVTKHKIFKTPAAVARQPAPLVKLVHWSATHCVFCGKKSARRAILMNGLRCCGACDRVQWAEKITKTEAKKVSRLADEILLAKLRYGTYFSAGVLTTMFLRKDVEDLAERVGGRAKGRRKRLEGKAAAVGRANAAGPSSGAGGKREVIFIDD